MSRARGTAKRPVVPVTRELLDHRITTYAPKGVVSAEQWGLVREHVRGATRRYEPDSLSAVYLTMRACTMLAVWALDHHIPLDLELLYSEENVERFSATGMRHLADHSRASYRSALRRIGRKVTKRAEWAPEPARIRRTTFSDPYTSADIEWLWDVARHQKSETRRRAAVTAVALCYGGGLQGPEYSLIEGSSIELVDGVVVAHVPGRLGRSVPVLPTFTEELMLLAGRYQDRPLFSDRTPVRNWTSAVLAQVEIPPGAPRLVPNRLRITWMVHLLTMGVRVSELRHLAGVKTTKGWEDLAKFVPMREPAELHALIGGLR